MNRLGSETSPYLQQHRDNPVDWWAWSPEAFAHAEAEDKPVLVSIGYSACHWCHVMAHESFEDKATAAVMNDLFVNIKVDREERPDVDAVYMEATQAMTGGGGWPMTVFCTPDGRPFFAGTYFPRESLHGRPGFADLMRGVREAWDNRRSDLLTQADQLTEAIRARSTLPAPAFDRENVAESATFSLSKRGGDWLGAGYDQLRGAFDAEWGGFGRAPKFPQASYLDLLLRAYSHNGSAATLEMLTTTLDAMASGGIYDHLGGGFSRYSVDAFWMVPHFEKMLYDQAQLLRSYVALHLVTGEPRYRQVAEEIVTYVLSALGQPGGGIASAEDADSEGEEGKFYVWRLEEIADALDGPDGHLTLAATTWYGATAAGNFEGANILHRPVRGDLARPADVEEARQRLFAVRHNRVHPGLDDKALTEWNAMWVSSLAWAGAALANPSYVAAAADTARFLLDELREPDGARRWLRSWQGGRANPALLGYAVDHAWLIDAFTRLAEANGQAEWIGHARSAADALIDRFWDDEVGGFFTTAHDGERLIVRQKDTYDGATPSANGVAAVALLRLAAITGESRYRDTAEATLAWLSPSLANHPIAHTYALGGIDLLVNGLDEVVIAGNRHDLVAAVHEQHLPRAVVVWGERFPSPLWEGREDGRAYVCRDYACRQPVTEPAELLAQLTTTPDWRQ